MGKNMTKKKLLYLCTGNSCRSQMAEGWTRALKSDIYDVFSAGVETHGLNPYALKVMAEAGIDISGHSSDHIDKYLGTGIDIVVTVCSNAHESCPVFPESVRVVHHAFEDPPKLAQGLSGEDEILECYRKVRDQIKRFVEDLPNSLS